ncbi:MAG TPA: serine hydrolase domain-containing protein, partial [Acidimicrobiales bacterium]|nr:serine hydrolase domain-containing protein [Acidimicrobiales bacterium]
LLAAQAPWWEPGTASGYHALTQGYLVGEVVRRVAGQSLGTFFAKEVSGPLGADFHIGLPDEHHHRVANVIPPPALAIDADPTSVAARTLGNPVLRAEAAWENDWRRAEIPAANGHGNARSVATIQAVLAGGGESGGVRLLSPAGCEAVFEEQAHGTDLVLGAPLRLGIGYGLNSAELPVSPNPRACFWGGWGGSIVVVDLDARMTVAYMMNRMGEGTLGDQRGAGIVLAAFSALAGG